MKTGVTSPRRQHSISRGSNQTRQNGAWFMLLGVLSVLSLTIMITTHWSSAADNNNAPTHRDERLFLVHRDLDDGQSRPNVDADTVAQVQGQTQAGWPANTTEDAPIEADLTTTTTSPPSATPMATPTQEPEPTAVYKAKLRSESRVAPSIHTPAPTPQPTTQMPTRHKDFDHTVSRESGIIISLHDSIVPMGLSLIKDLRCLGNHELIQVYHCFDNELSAESRALLLMNERRLEIIDSCTTYVHADIMSMEKGDRFRNWWLKPLALHHTDLKHVILLDADVIPMRNPAILRSLPLYKEKGTMFFYDRVIPQSSFFNEDARDGRGGNMLQQMIRTYDYRAANLTGPAWSDHLLQSFAYNRHTCHEMDSSMVAVDKTRWGPAKDVLWYLITRKRLEFDFSWGDKEAFWLAFEIANVSYAFSPWAASVVAHSSNRDVEEHSETLCGSLAHFVPSEDDEPELLYVNGKALLAPYPGGVDEVRHASYNLLHNANPSHVTPRQVRSQKLNPEEGDTRGYQMECLIRMGSTPVDDRFRAHLLRRRMFYTTITFGYYPPLEQCLLSTVVVDE